VVPRGGAREDKVMNKLVKFLLIVGVQLVGVVYLVVASCQ